MQSFGAGVVVGGTVVDVWVDVVVVWVVSVVVCVVVADGTEVDVEVSAKVDVEETDVVVV